MKTTESFYKKVELKNALGEDQSYLEFKSHTDLELCFDTTIAAAKAMGFEFRATSKKWVRPCSKPIKIFKIIDIIKNKNAESLLIIVEISKDEKCQRLMAICAFDDKEVARKNGFQWDPKDKIWAKEVQKEKEVSKEPEKEVCFSDIQETPISQEECNAVGIKTELYEFQRKAVAKMVAQKTCYNGSDMGNGKSLMAIVATLVTNPSRILIVCPATLKFNWKNEVLKHTSIKKEEIFILDTKNQEKYKNEKIIIVNYDILEKMQEFLKALKFSHVICDEFHFAKNPNAKRTQALEKIIEKIEYKFFLSGTPITKNAADFFTASKSLGMQLPQDFSAFREEYCYKKKIQIPTMRTPITQYFGLKNEKIFRNLIHEKYFRFESKEVKLPDYIFQDFILESTEKETKDFEKMIFEYFKEKGEKGGLEGQALEGFLYEMMNGQDPSLMTIKSRLALLKAPKTVKFALDLLEDEDQKLVIYSDHLDSSEKILSLLLKSKIRACKIDGSSSQKDREEAVKAFQEEGDLQVLVGTSAIATGLTLTAANIMVLNDRSWNIAVNEQLAKRIHRIGQDKRCMQYNMIIELSETFNIDKLITKLLKEKALTFSKFKE